MGEQPLQGGNEMNTADRYFFNELWSSVGTDAAHVWLKDQSESQRTGSETSRSGKDERATIHSCTTKQASGGPGMLCMSCKMADPPGRERSLTAIYTALERRAAVDYLVLGTERSRDVSNPSMRKEMSWCAPPSDCKRKLHEYSDSTDSSRTSRFSTTLSGERSTMYRSKSWGDFELMSQNQSSFERAPEDATRDKRGLLYTDAAHVLLDAEDGMFRLVRK